MHIIAGLPGLHGLLIATIGILYYRQTKRNKKCLIVELICSGLLIVAWLLIIANVWLELQSFVSSFLGWWIATLTTLVLNIAAIVKAVKAIINKRKWTQKIVVVLLNFIVLLIYLIFAFWLTNIVLMMLLGVGYP